MEGGTQRGKVGYFHPLLYILAKKKKRTIFVFRSLANIKNQYFYLSKGETAALCPPFLPLRYTQVCTLELSIDLNTYFARMEGRP